MGGSPIDDVTGTAKDVAYVSVGLGVLAFQRIQVLRRALAKELSEHFASSRPHA